MFDRDNVKDIYSLSPMQEGMLFHYILDEKTTASFLQTVFTIEMLQGEMDLKLLQDSFNRLIARYDILRTFFSHHKTKKPRQIVLKKWEINIHFEDISHLDHKSKEEYIENFKTSDRKQGFNLVKEIPTRVSMIKISPTGFRLIWSSHHIIMDGWCEGILFNDLTRIYDSLKNKTPLQLNPVTPYSKYIQWLEKQDKQQGLDFWRNYLQGYEKPAPLPKPALKNEKDYIPEEYSFVIDRDLADGLNRMIKETRVTVNTLLQTVWGILLQKYNNTGDVVFGTIVSGRPPGIEGIENMVGLFVNLVPIRITIEKENQFSKLLEQVQEKTALAKSYEFLPLADIQANSLLKRDLIDHILVFENFPAPDELIEANSEKRLGFRVTTVESFRKTEYDLNIVVQQEQNKNLELGFIFNAAVYPSAFVQKVAAQVKYIIRQITVAPGIDVRTISILTQEEKQRILYEFNDTHGTYPEDKPIHSLYEEQAEITPHHIAVKAPGLQEAHDIHLTYRELKQAARAVAAVLQKKGIGPGQTAASMIENSVEMIVSLLGIMISGAVYLPVSPQYPVKRMLSILNDSAASILLTTGEIIKKFKFIPFQSFERSRLEPFVTPARDQVRDLDRLQMPDRSAINYEKYTPYIAQAMVKNSMILQFSRGCVFNCAYCFKIWSKGYFCRSAENIFAEINMYYKMGIRRFGFVDDLPNFDIKESSKLYRLIIKHCPGLHLHFPNGIRGDILTEDYIDLMVEAGAVTMDLALETSSKRLQRLIRKNLNIDRLRDNLEYIVKKYPHVILECQILHGLPTETEEEAIDSLNFIKNLHWIHFPYLHILKIYPHTEMARLAVEQGVSPEAIEQSADLGYHEIPATMPFPASFTRQYQADFVNRYFMCKDRLLAVLPQQMKTLTRDELVQKYNSYLPLEINSFADLLNYAGISPEEVKEEFLPRDYGFVPCLNEKIKEHFPGHLPGEKALKILLLDLSQYFSHQNHMVYDVVEPPLGLMYLVTHLHKTHGSKIDTKIAKSRIDFDGFDELKVLIHEFKPQVIGVRSLNFYKDFFHKAIALVKQWAQETVVIAGGPYATSSFKTMLADKNIDLAVLGEGEITFAQIIGKILENNNKLPGDSVLKNIPGLAFIEQKNKTRQNRENREVLLLDRMWSRLLPGPAGKPEPINGKVITSNHPAYVIYTSGSTGQPKGVMVPHRGLVNQVAGLINRFHLQGLSSLNYIMLAAFTFDVSLMHIFLALTTGAKLHLIPEQVKKDSEKLWSFIHTRRIDILNIVPAFMKVLLRDIKKKQINFKYLFVGGDVFDRELYTLLKETFNTNEIINIYGPTETTINAALYCCPDKNPNTEIIPIGKPIMNYHIYILDKDSNLVPPGAAGEIHISGPGLAHGYLNHPELTSERFIRYNRSYRSSKSYISYLSYIYKTGDLGQWHPDGNIQFLGRIDRQVKVRGFRIELGEIEVQLRKHPGVKEAIVITREDTTAGKCLCAYIVFECQATEVSEMRDYLLKELPDYMVPAYFVPIERLPLTPAGKPDRKALPEPAAVIEPGGQPPRDKIEEKLAGLWSEVIGIDKKSIGIDTNFFQLGGHSLKATILASRIHKEFNVKVSLAQIFKTPVIRGLARYIKEAGKERFQSVMPVEKKEYYGLSSAQKRLYVLQQLDEQSIVYNMPTAVVLEGTPERNRLEQVFKKLIERHESLRTCFEMINSEPVQRIHDEVEFKIEYKEVEREAAPFGQVLNAFGGEGTANPGGTGGLAPLLNDFIRSFDLSRPPLLRVGLIKINETEHIAVMDIHHIVTDGLSMGTLVKDLMALYEGKDLPPLKLQYKDYSEWLKTEMESGALKARENYWLKQFKGDIPAPSLPTDYEYPREGQRSYEGSHQVFVIDKELTTKIKNLVSKTNTTLYILLMAVHNILISKYTGRQDIVVGTGAAGRQHADMENIIGMFVNMLALRNRPEENKSFIQFLAEVKENALDAFKNQDYQFQDLVRKLDLKSDTTRNPLFDTVFQINDIEISPLEIPGLRLKPYGYEDKVARFDLVTYVQEPGNTIQMIVSYALELYKTSTIENMCRNYLEIINRVIDNPYTLIKDITISIPTARLEAKADIFPGEQEEFGF
jgi:amino acid adenylation domain-containing protein